MVQEGDPQIVFSTVDVCDQKIDIGDFKGQKILLTFLRDSTCPFCNLRIHQLISGLKEYVGNEFNIIAVFSSPKEEILRYIGKQNPPFVIIPDPDFELYNKYSIHSSLFGKIKAMFRFRPLIEILKNNFFSLKSLTRKNTLPADFLIDTNGIIEKVHYGKDFGDHMETNTILSWVTTDAKKSFASI